MTIITNPIINRLRKGAIAMAAILTLAVTGTNAATPERKIVRPDLEQIKKETTDPKSKYYYPKLMEDYEPYRRSYNPGRQKELEPLYSKPNHTREECRAIMNFAEDVLADNPFDLRQLNFRVYSYGKLGKENLAKIWQQKLNSILMTIATSGTGIDPENSWIVVLPAHEYDFLNLSGFTATGQKFVEPYYDFISVTPKKDSDPKGYYFDIKAILEEYYRKHPNELED